MLVPMSEETFRRFVAEEIEEYAQSNVKSGRWGPEVALDTAKREFNRLLPQGRSTPDHHVLQIVAPNSAEVVGWLWWAVTERSAIREAFILDIKIFEEFRRRGYARLALQEMERLVRKAGLSRISLHVFAYNQPAQALYAALGFVVTGLNMQKVLNVEPAGHKI